MQITAEIMTQDVAVAYIVDTEGDDDQVVVTWMRNPRGRRGIEVELRDKNGDTKYVLKRGVF